MVFPELATWQVIVGMIVGLLGLIAGIYGGAQFFRWLKSKKQGYPGEEAIEAALLPIIQYGIMAAYRLSEGVMDELGARLQGVDKAAIAQLVYELIPNQIEIGDVAVSVAWIKTIIPKERFAELVQQAFEELVGFMNANGDRFSGKLEELLDLEGAASVMARVG